MILFEQVKSLKYSQKYKIQTQVKIHGEKHKRHYHVAIGGIPSSGH